MIDRITEGLVPILLLRVAAVSVADKRRFADMLGKLSAAYLDNDPIAFNEILATTSFSNEWRAAMARALWPERYSENPSQR